MDLDAAARNNTEGFYILYPVSSHSTISEIGNVP